MVTEIVPDGQHLTRALEMAEGIAAFPQPAMLADRLRRDRGLRHGARTKGWRSRRDRGRQMFASALEGAARFAGGEGRGGAGAGV